MNGRTLEIKRIRTSGALITFKASIKYSGLKLIAKSFPSFDKAVNYSWTEPTSGELAVVTTESPETVNFTVPLVVITVNKRARSIV